MSRIGKTALNDFSSGAEDISGAKILIVDDLLLLRELIKNYLQTEGFTNLYTAENGVEALELVEEIKPDILVLDILMPEMNGFEVCRKIRSMPAYANMPILVQTGVEESEERLEVFKVGATDLVLKPINGSELVARVKVHLQNVFMHRRQQQYHQRMVDELAAASRIQESLLPSREHMEEVRQKTGIHVNAFYEASSELGGDFWGMRLLERQKLAIFMADFSGHGVVSALNTFRLHTLINESALDWYSPKNWLQTLNEHLIRVTSVEHFATFFYGVCDPQENRLSYAAAAAPPFVIGKPDGDVTLCDTAGLPLGISAAAEYEQHEFTFEAGDFLFCYSDALIETKSHDGRVLTEGNIADELGKWGRNSVRCSMIDAILDVYPGREIRPLPDDLTILSLERGA